MTYSIIPLVGEDVTSLDIKRDDLELVTIKLSGDIVTVIELGSLVSGDTSVPTIDTRPGVQYPTNSSSDFDYTAQEYAILSRVNFLADQIVDSLKISFNYADSEIAENEAAAQEAFAALRAVIVAAQMDIAENHVAAQAAYAEVRDAVAQALALVADNHEFSTIAIQNAEGAFSKLSKFAQTVYSFGDALGDANAAITVQAGARATADEALAGQITTIKASLGSSNALVVQQSVAKSTRDLALAAIENALKVSLDGNNASFRQIATSQASRDSAITTLVTNLNAQTAAGFQAGLYEERTARATDKLATSSSIQRLSASIDNSNAAVSNVQVASATRTSSISAVVQTLTAAVKDAVAGVSSERVARIQDGVSLAGQIDRLSATTSAKINASVLEEKAARTTQNDALAAVTRTLSAQIGTSNAQIVAESVARTTGDKSVASTTTALTALVGQQSSIVQQQAVASATRDASYAATVNNLSAQAKNSVSAISSANAVYSSATSSLAGRIDNFAVQLGQTKAAVQQEQVARTTNDSAIASSQQTIAAAIRGNTALIQDSTTARVTAEKAVNDRVTSLISIFNGKTASYDQQISVLQSSDASQVMATSNLKTSFSAGSGGANLIANSDMNGIENYTYSNTGMSGARYGFDPNPLSQGRYYSYLPAGSGYSDLRTPKVFVNPGFNYEFSVLAENDNGGGCALFFEWLASDGSVIRTDQFGGTNYSNSINSNTGLPTYRMGGFATAPNNAVTVDVIMRHNAYSGFSTYVNYAQPMLRVASPNQTTLSPYQPGTQVNVAAINASIKSVESAASTANGATAQSVKDLNTSFTGQLSQTNATVEANRKAASDANSSTAAANDKLTAVFQGGLTGGGNDIPDSELTSVAGWNFASTASSPSYGLDLAGFFSANGPVHVLWSNMGGTPSANQVNKWRGPSMTAIPGVVYECSVLAAYYRCFPCQIGCEFYDNTGALINTLYGAISGGAINGGVGGDLTNFQLIGGFVQAPSGSVSRRIVLRFAANGSDGNPHGFFTRPMSRAATAGQTILSPYQPGSAANAAALNASITDARSAASDANRATAQTVTDLTATVARGGGSGNLITNSDFIGGYDGWSASGSISGGIFGLNLGNPGEFSPASGTPGTLYGHYSGTPTAGQNLQWISNGLKVPVVAGQSYEVSIYAAFHRMAKAEIYAVLCRADGTAYQNVGLQSGGTNKSVNGNAGAAGDIANYSQIGGIFNIPSGCSYIYLLAQGITSGESEPYVFLSRPSIKLTSSGQTSLTAYSSGTQANVAKINTTAQVTADKVSGLQATYQLALTLDGSTGGYKVVGARRADGQGAVFTTTFDSNVVINGTLIVQGTLTKGHLDGNTQGYFATPRTFFTVSAPSNGTFTVPAGVTWINVEIWGAGGGGGVLGGAGGDYVANSLSVSPGQNISYSCGAGGSGSNGGGNASAGGNTSFGSMLAKGGTSGDGRSNSGNSSGGLVIKGGNAPTPPAARSNDSSTTPGNGPVLGGTGYGIPVSSPAQNSNGGANGPDERANSGGSTSAGSPGGPGLIKVLY